MGAPDALEEEESVPSEMLGTNLRITVCANQGGRKYMEDRVHIHREVLPTGETNFVFVGVYDGHGGSEAPDFARRHLLASILEQEGFHSDNQEEVVEAIREGFLQTHHAMRKVVDQWQRTASGFTSTSGTTASVAFIRKGLVYTGHVGDSAIVVGSRNKKTGAISSRQVTIDHKPDSPEELKRINDAGGEVMCKAGVMRVVWTRPIRGHTGPVRRSTLQEKIPFLAVARSLGDLWSYNSDLDDFIVSPDPDIEVIELEPSTCCLVLGSDGLWNVIRPQYSMDIVNAHEWRELKEKEGNTQGNNVLDRIHSNHSRWLVRHGLRGWGCLRADNITAITVIFDPPNATLPSNSECIEISDPGLDIETVLTEFPSAMLRITKTGIQTLKTEPVELVYSGAVDPPLSALLKQGIHKSFSFSGPGFTPYNLENGEQQRRQRGSISFHRSPSTPLFSPLNRSNKLERSNLSHSTTTSGLTDSPKTDTKFFLPPNRTGDAPKEEEEDDERKLLASNGPGTNTNSSNADKTRMTNGVTTGRKPKYVCRKHGLTCAKVKSMNAEFFESEGRKAPSSPTPANPPSPTLPTPSTAPAPPAPIPEPPKSSTAETNTSHDQTSSTSFVTAKRRKTQPLTPKLRSPPVFHNTRQQSRVTRSGSALPPTRPPRRKSVAAPPQASCVRGMKRSRSADSTRPISSPQPQSRMSTRSVEFKPSSSTLQNCKTGVSGQKIVRERLAQIRKDVKRSAYLFRCRRLQYCLGRKTTNASILNKTSTISSSTAARKSLPSRLRNSRSCGLRRPRSALSDARTPVKDTEERGGSGSETKESSTVLLEKKTSNGVSRKNSAFVQSNVSPRFLSRSPIHPLPFLSTKVMNQKPATTNRKLPASPKSYSDDETEKVVGMNGLKRKFRHLEKDGCSKEEAEPSAKKHRFWDSLISMFGGHSVPSSNKTN